MCALDVEHGHALDARRPRRPTACGRPRGRRASSPAAASAARLTTESLPPPTGTSERADRPAGGGGAAGRRPPTGRRSRARSPAARCARRTRRGPGCRGARGSAAVAGLGGGPSISMRGRHRRLEVAHAGHQVQQPDGAVERGRGARRAGGARRRPGRRYDSVKRCVVVERVAAGRPRPSSQSALQPVKRKAPTAAGAKVGRTRVTARSPRARFWKSRKYSVKPDRREDRGDQPEAHDDLGLAPRGHLEVVVDRASSGTPGGGSA